MYKHLVKRAFDVICALTVLIVLSPLFLVLTVLGAIEMKGNPFFTQERPGYKEKVFRLIKFRTMTNEKDEEGNLLSDEMRINKYGTFLRSTSLDELPEAVNILIGDMSLIGPRPLLVKYLPYYTEQERLRHSVRPGLTGYAQVHGRNCVSWEDRFDMDIWYANNISLKTDVKVIIDTVKAVVHHDGIVLNALEDFDEYRKNSNTKVKSPIS